MSIKNLILNFFSKTIGYFDGEMKTISSTGSGVEFVSAKPNFTPFIVIIGRGFYSERQIKLPMNSKEAKKYLSLEFSEQRAVFNLTFDNGATKGNAWVINKSVPTAWFMIPESWVITRLFSDKFIDLNKNGAPVFYFENKGIVYSQYKNNIIDSLERFKTSIGVAHIGEKIQFSDKELPNVFSNFFTKKISFRLSSFFTPHKLELLPIVKRLLLPSFALFFLYQLIFSVYLLINSKIVENNVSKLSENANIVLDKDLLLAEKLQLVKDLNAGLLSTSNNKTFFYVLGELFQNTKFTNIRKERGRYILRGATQKASDLIYFLSQIEGVEDVQFDYPTRKVQQQDVFVISFEVS